ncbi:SOS response-associated peptidase [Saliphagus sp. LR7]|uniref:SOS response-associated peptidase n=1 Tax=Saliphagus sp. LR7 TaxID=2282654 RepID=UPI000DF82F53|nr:SOS response-associated peptidase [Saliphagus sp. LR7]
MCGRYTLFADREDLEDRFDARFEGPYERRYNMAPGQRLPVVTDAASDTIRSLEWGLEPDWDGDRLINARAETVASKPSFRAAYEGVGRDGGVGESEGREAGRCLVLADGFYEWADGQPYRVAFEDDRPFAMAGLWRSPETETTQAGLDAFGGGSDAEEPAEVGSFTVVTTEPNALVADLHHRMAAVLEPDGERQWLSAEDPRGVLESYPADEMRAYPVSTAVNGPDTDDPSLVEPI